MSKYDEESEYQRLMFKLSYFENIEIDESHFKAVEEVNRHIVEFITSASNQDEYVANISIKLNNIITKLNYQKSELSKMITDSTYNKNAYKQYIEKSLVLHGSNSDN